MGIKFLEIVMLYVNYWPYFFIIPQCWKIILVGLDMTLHLFYYSSAHAHWCIMTGMSRSNNQLSIIVQVRTPLNGEWLECPTIYRQSLNGAWSWATGNVLPSIVNCWSVHAHCAWEIWNVKPSTSILAGEWLGMSNHRPSIVRASVHAHWRTSDRECPTINCWSF